MVDKVYFKPTITPPKSSVVLLRSHMLLITPSIAFDQHPSISYPKRDGAVVVLMTIHVPECQ